MLDSELSNEILTVKPNQINQRPSYNELLLLLTRIKVCKWHALSTNLYSKPQFFYTPIDQRDFWRGNLHTIVSSEFQGERNAESCANLHLVGCSPEQSIFRRKQRISYFQQNLCRVLIVTAAVKECSYKNHIASGIVSGVGILENCN